MRPPLPLAGLTLLLSVAARLFAQPVAPTPERIAELRAMSEINPRIAADSSPFTVNIASREEVRQFYRAIYGASENPAMNWTGTYTSGTAPVTAAGDTAAAFKEAARVRINFFRALAGVSGGITFNSTFSAKAQQAALMMSANNTLQHTGIPTSWTFYTAAGAEAAASSNLAIGTAGSESIDSYIADKGANNTAVGHRRWVLFPQTREMGTGDVPGNATLSPANANWIIDSHVDDARPATRTTQVPYPPAGYVPYQLVWPRWSFSYPGADFSASTVTMSRGGQSIAAKLEPIAPGAGENALVWVYNGLDSDQLTAHPKPAADTVYTVNVNNVRIGNATQNFTYNVTVFDPDATGSDTTPMAISGPATPTVGVQNTYTTTKPAFAGGLEWRTMTFGNFSTIYDAEAGLDGIAAFVNSGYNVVQTEVAGAGRAAFHFAQSQRWPKFQSLTLPETFYVASSSAALTFLSRLGFATDSQVAHVQIALDDGAAWNEVYSQTGTSSGNASDPGERAFVARNISLAPYAGRTIRVRFLYTATAEGIYFPQSDAGVGWYLDNITLASVQTVTAGASTNAGASANFSFAPASAGAVGLQARGVLFGAYGLDWSPVVLVNAINSGPAADPGRLINLSILTPLAAGETMTLGTVLGGDGTSGSKALVARAAGPALTQLGVSDVLPDPTMKLNNTSATPAVIIATNDNWLGDASLRTAFAQVGAFAYASADSKDAGIYQQFLTAGNYTVQVTDAGGAAGTVIAELYDATPSAAFTSTTPRLINVSVIKPIAAGTTLTAGFVIGGSTSETVLIRAVGPTLGAQPFNIAGVMADPKIELVNNSTGAKIAENDDWGTPVAPATATTTQLSAAFTSVAAFALANAATKDAVLLITLAPGQYSARVTGADGGGGTAIVEVYEAP